jgi:hypothetical protein
MHQWWERHKGVTMKDYSRDEIEDITGCIPLLLDKCVVEGKIDLTVPELRNIYNKSAGFVQRIRDITKKSNFKWQWYVQLIPH